jgi:hypothetical protein
VQSMTDELAGRPWGTHYSAFPFAADRFGSLAMSL